MAKTQLPLPGTIVKKSNALARARWSAESVWEPRLVALLASKIRADDTDLREYSIPISEIMPDRVTGGKDYREIQAVVDNIMQRVLTIKDENGRGWSKYNFFSKCRYNPEEGILEIGFHPDLRPHYLNLQKHFAQYNLMEYLTLPSIYSQRLFEILKSWSSMQEVTLPLSELHEMLATTASLRKDSRNFRIRVLEKAHLDITSKTSFKYAWELLKRGRGGAVVAVRFIFGKKKAQEIEAKATEKTKERKRSYSIKQQITATNCLKEHGKECDGGHQKNSICKICKEMR